jgi:hypothetical protein
MLTLSSLRSKLAAVCVLLHTAAVSAANAAADGERSSAAAVAVL